MEKISEILQEYVEIIDPFDRYNYNDMHERHVFLNRKRGELGETLLHYYAGYDNEPNGKNICSYLVYYGANVNSIDNSRMTGLHRAVYACKIDITKLLLNHGAYVNAQDANQNTPLHMASTCNLELCHLLLECDADPNIKNSSHDTPILLAVKSINNSINGKQNCRAAATVWRKRFNERFSSTQCD